MVGGYIQHSSRVYSPFFTYTYPTGEVLDGSFENGVPIGNAVVTLPTGVKKKCHFDKGVIKYDE